MSVIGNIIWLLCGGLMIAIEYLTASIMLMITIIGIPFGLQSLKLAVLTLWPFGKRVENNPASASGVINLIMNVIWLIIGGFWICLTHLCWGVLLCVTIIGIPFGRQHFKMARLALLPFGKTVSY